MKRPFKLPDYKTYDTSQGRGGPDEWRGDFKRRMGYEEAQAYVHKENLDVWSVLGIRPDVPWAEVKKAYRIKCQYFHSDRMAYTGLTKEQADAGFKAVQAAYAVLKKRYRQ